MKCGARVKDINFFSEEKKIWFSDWFVNKCIKQIKSPISIQMHATYSRLNHIIREPWYSWTAINLFMTNYNNGF